MTRRPSRRASRSYRRLAIPCLAVGALVAIPLVATADIHHARKASHQRHAPAKPSAPAQPSAPAKPSAPASAPSTAAGAPG